MNNTKTTTLAIVAVLMAATLVVGTFATVATTQPALAIAKKPPGHGDKNTRDNNGSGNGNGNTVTIEECKNRGSASGFDTATNQECENLICTHPGENATCVQEEELSSTTAGTRIASEVTGSGTAENTNLDNRLNCPNGSALSATITFHASETNGGTVSGTWTISDARNAAGTSFGIKSGTFNGGDIGRNNYHLTGVENVDEACSQFGGGVTPNPITISGQCGTGVAIEFLANQLPQNPPGFPPFRESGTFTGNVNCVVS